MPKNTQPVSPEARYSNYVADNLGIVEIDTDQMLPGCEDEFKSNQSMEEGVGGLKAIDTTYENTSQDMVECPRSDWDDDLSLRGQSIKTSTNRKPAPYPMDLDRYPHRRL